MNLNEQKIVNADDIYSDLCLKIEKLEYMPGEGLSESRICHEYGATRNMVRMAFSKLIARGLMVVYPQRGSFVCLIDLDYIQNLTTLRECIEQEALYRVSQLSEEERQALVVKLIANTEKQKKVFVDNTVNDEFYKLDKEYHSDIMETASMLGTFNLISESMIHFRRWRNFELRATKRDGELIRQHVLLQDDIQKQDWNAARELLHQHLNTMKYFQQFSEEDQKKYFVKK